MAQVLRHLPPVVEDAETFGAVAAANALSDIFAMGARPIFALNVVNFPREALPLEYLEVILRGGAAVATEAGVPILGGHSVDDPELKYGLVAIGTVHPERVITNAGARPGDLLVLTKPLGIGVVTTAIKADRVDERVIEQAVRVMTTLNRVAAETMVDVGVNAATDVTGFGLLGHLWEVVRASGVGARVRAREVPIVAGARALAEQGIVPGGTRRNREALAEIVRWAPAIDEVTQLLLCDAQTSGGLLIAVAPERCDALVERLRAAPTLAAAVIGELDDNAGVITVT